MGRVVAPHLVGQRRDAPPPGGVHERLAPGHAPLLMIAHPEAGELMVQADK